MIAAAIGAAIGVTVAHFLNTRGKSEPSSSSQTRELTRAIPIKSNKYEASGFGVAWRFSWVADPEGESRFGNGGPCGEAPWMVNDTQHDNANNGNSCGKWSKGLKYRATYTVTSGTDGRNTYKQIGPKAPHDWLCDEVGIRYLRPQIYRSQQHAVAEGLAASPSGRRTPSSRHSRTRRMKERHGGSDERRTESPPPSETDGCQGRDSHGRKQKSEGRASEPRKRDRHDHRQRR
jgi:hypothetical protein